MQNNQTSAEGTSAAQQGMTGEELAQFEQFKKIKLLEQTRAPLALHGDNPSEGQDYCRAVKARFLHAPDEVGLSRNDMRRVAAAMLRNLTVFFYPFLPCGQLFYLSFRPSAARGIYLCKIKTC